MRLPISPTTFLICSALLFASACGTEADLDPAETVEESGDEVVASRVLFNGDFETGDLTQWDYVGRCRFDRITVYDRNHRPSGAPNPRQGSFAAKLRVLDTDVDPCTSTTNPRAQLQSATTLLADGAEIWEAWSIYIPTSFPSVTQWMVFQQDYGPPWNGSPSLGWDIGRVNGVDSFVLNRGAQYNHDRIWSMPIVRGRWIDFLVHKKMARNSSGFIEAWVDGQQIRFRPGNVTRLSTQTMHNDQRTVGFFLTSYRAAGQFDVGSIFFDGGRVGTTRSSVELH